MYKILLNIESSTLGNILRIVEDFQLSNQKNETGGKCTFKQLSMMYSGVITDEFYGSLNQTALLHLNPNGPLSKRAYLVHGGSDSINITCFETKDGIFEFEGGKHSFFAYLLPDGFKTLSLDDNKLLMIGTLESGDVVNGEYSYEYYMKGLEIEDCQVTNINLKVKEHLNDEKFSDEDTDENQDERSVDGYCTKKVLEQNTQKDVKDIPNVVKEEEKDM